ncbi:hypothetical protein GN244_ATG03449 [Phytophthora infestans]|uniref:Uncharacterized protein n=1 Tax=Phytophthora infestans TaxID=4787 RepID=A0A833SAD0_PHYIN|nr:hypothetical protein GN244_ATG03449 [Phytophthora infestans]KAF4129390.1 hypothetical protein GN958_ATG21345 [Phytophthora infestans]
MDDIQGAGPRALVVLAEVLEDLRDALLVASSAEHAERPLISDARLDINTFGLKCDELMRLACLMSVPNVFISSAGTRLLGVDVLAMLCYRLSHLGKLSGIRKQFDCYLDDQWKNTLLFNDTLYAARHQAYVQAVTDQTNDLVQKNQCLFMEQLKQHLQAMQAALDCIPAGDKENLLRGRLRESGLVPNLQRNDLVKDLDVLIYGDSVHGINEFLCSPFRNAYVSTSESALTKL